MHKEILTKQQVALLPTVKNFNKDFYLVGGTAIALHLGHRHSIDFDMFTYKPFTNSAIRRKIQSSIKIDKEIVNHTGEYTFICNEVKFTFYNYPFNIVCKESFESIRMPDLLTLAAMKAYAFGGRAKWKDYVDMYFILKYFYKWPEVVSKAQELFQDSFNEKLFRIQLAYFDDINYAEQVEFMPGFEVSDIVVKQKLMEFSLA